MPGISDIVAQGIVEARARPPIEAFIEDRTCTDLTRTLRSAAALGWTITPATRLGAMRLFNLEGP